MSDYKHKKDSVPHVDIDQLVHHTRLPNTRFSCRIDRFIRWIGEKVSWIWLVLLSVVIINVASRHILGQGRVELEEIQWHLYSTGFLIGMSYCFEKDDHVRVDIVHENLGLRTQAWIELFGLLVFLLPFIVWVFYYAVPFALHSFSLGEISDAPGGLGARWVIKSMMAIGFGLLGLAALSRLSRVTNLLFKFPGGVNSPSESQQ